jgi:hypothetical protein
VQTGLVGLLVLGYGLLCRHSRRSTARRLLLTALHDASGPADRGAAPPPDRVVREAVEQTTRWRFLSPSCLGRALALRQILAWSGADARVRLGVRRTHRGLDGHAWVECHGQPVGEDPVFVSRFAVCETS